jgi:adenylate cyclase
MIRRLHLLSGLVLFSYVVVHLLNHSLLLVSIATADAALRHIHRVLILPPVTALLLGALLLHVALALLALWRRRTLRFSGYEAMQYLLGFALPLLLLPHIAATRIPDSLYEQNWGYYRNLLTVWWHLDPGRAVNGALMLVLAWGHACLGLRAWLRLKPWFPRWWPALGAAALLLPSLALAGLLAGGNEVRLRLAIDPGFMAAVRADMPPEPLRVWLNTTANQVAAGLALAVAAVLLARLVRRALQRRRGLVRIGYPDGRVVTVPHGFSVLEASWLRGIPHASVCGGRGRCSTCRVRVRGEAGALPSPAEAEARVLARIGAGPEIRLACQLRPTGPVAVEPLLDPAMPAGSLLRFRAPGLLGEERPVAILFADLRDFTRLSEHRLPFDVVHLLNRWFRAMGEAVEVAGGRVDKFIGDGVMALFGTEGSPDPARACREALAAARLMAEGLAALNQRLAPELGEGLRIGIGVHVGPVILGMLGHGQAVGLTAIGDAVNTASRLESACKELRAELVVSEAVLLVAGVALAGEPHALAVRGRTEPLAVRAFARGTEAPQPDSNTIPS